MLMRCSSKLLRHPQFCERRQMPHLQQVVLQCSWQYLLLPYCQPSRPRASQGSLPPPKVDPRRYRSRVLSMWDQERLPPRLHPRQVGLRRRPLVSFTLRLHALLQGHELGHRALAAVDRGSLLSTVASTTTHRSGTAASSTSQPPDDREVGGDVEGEPGCHHFGSRKGSRRG